MAKELNKLGEGDHTPFSKNIKFKKKFKKGKKQKKQKNPLAIWFPC